jgi:hypothetical protein
MDLGGIKTVDAHPHARRDEIAYRLGQFRIRKARCQPQVDDIGARLAIVARLACDVFARQPGGIVDLGADLDIPRTIFSPDGFVAQPRGDLA